MAHGLNMTVVAEGVETREQMDFLLRRRCDQAQGYFFGRPMPMNKLIATVMEGERELEQKYLHVGGMEQGLGMAAVAVGD
jgi:EAL domain-containing protein (putative c-di-GMP-specific phosphodiesterase class I)